MADHPLDAQLYYDGVWNDVSGDVRQTSPVTIVRGGGEVSEALRPSTASLTFNDPDGTYRPDRAASPLYGKVGRNTPLSLPGGVFEVSAWKPDRTISYDGSGRGDQTTDIEAGGLLRRIGTWRTPVISALDQTIPDRFGSNLIGHWRLEDSERATYPGPEVGELARPTQNFNASFGNTDAPPGANSSVQLARSSAITGIFLPHSAASGWRVAWALKLARYPDATTYAGIMNLQSDSYTYQIWVNDTYYRMYVFDRDTGSILTSVDFAYGAAPVNWTLMTMEVAPSGATSTWSVRWYIQGDDTVWSATGTSTAACEPLRQWQRAGNVYTEDSLSSAVYAVANSTDDLLDAYALLAFNGYPGETAGARFERLMDLYGLDWTIEGSASDTEAMGPQYPSTLLEHLKEIRDTDGGMVYDSPDALAVTFRTRVDLYSQDPALELTYGTDVAAPFMPVLDDLNAANKVTISQRVGGTFTAEDTTSIMSTQAPPDGIGEYAQDVTVNVDDDARLEQRASWALAAGTVPGARYSSIRIDLDANPELESACEALKPGDRVTVTGYDPDVIDLMIVTITDTRENQKRRYFTLACKPYTPHDVGIYDSTDYAWDLATCTLQFDTPAANHNFVVIITSKYEQWSTSAAFDIMIAGERIHVPAAGAAAPTGTGPFYQLLSGVTRAVNGVAKELPAGSEVHIYNLGRWAL